MAKVVFNRIEDSSLIDNYPIEDGNFWITGDGKTYIDYDDERIAVGGTPDTEMSDRSRNTVENNVIKQYVDDSIMSRKILWTNPKPNVQFSAQSITLSSDNYDVLEIYYYDWDVSTRRGMKSVKVLKGYNINLDTVFQSTTENMMYLASRRVIYTDATHLSVENVKGLNSQQLTVESVNEVCVPIKILGYKTGLFE